MPASKWGGVVFKILFLMLLIFASCKKKDKPSLVPVAPAFELTALNWDSFAVVVVGGAGTQAIPFVGISDELPSKVTYTLEGGVATETDLKPEGDWYVFEAKQGSTSKKYYATWKSSNTHIFDLKNGINTIDLNKPENQNTTTFVYAGLSFDKNKVFYTLKHGVEKETGLVEVTGTEKNLYSFDVLPVAGEAYKKTYQLKFINDAVYVQSVYYKNNKLTQGNGTSSSPYIATDIELFDKTKVTYDIKGKPGNGAVLTQMGSSDTYAFEVSANGEKEVYYVAFKSSNTTLATLKYDNADIQVNLVNGYYQVKADAFDKDKITYTLVNGVATATNATLTLETGTTNKYSFEVTAASGATKTYKIEFLNTNTAVRVTYKLKPIDLSGENNDTYAIEESSTTCFDEKQLQITRADDGTLIPFSALTTNVANKWTFTVKPQTGDAKVYTLTYKTTVPDGYTLICTAADLEDIKNNLAGKYIQGKDIDLTNIADFEPIGGNNSTPFSGTYDGQGYKIINLKVDVKEDDKYTTYAGLFGVASGAKLLNIAIEGGSVNTSGRGGAGGLVGRANNSNISNSYATATVILLLGYYNTDAPSSGGLVGSAFYTSISNSYATGNVAVNGGAPYGGGLVGYADNASISNSYATGNVNVVWMVEHNSFYAGGLVGDAENTTISNSYQTDKQVTQNGSLVDGYLPAGVTRISAAGQAQNAFTGWAFGTIWASFTGNGWPTFLNVDVQP